MDTLHAGAVDDYKAWRREQGVREVTLRHDLHALSQVCQYADRQGWMEGNPVRLVKMPSDRDSRNERVLTNEEERTYFEAARGLVAGDVGRLILLQGMRPDEVLSTIKDSIDLAVGSLVVEQSKTRAGRRTLDLTSGVLLTDFASPEVQSRDRSIYAVYIWQEAAPKYEHPTAIKPTQYPEILLYRVTSCLKTGCEMRDAGTGEVIAPGCCCFLHSPSRVAAFSRNRLPSRMQRRTIFSERCPVWFMMQRSLAPFAAAWVAWPDRRLWPA